ncbi:cellulase family glycosylhydrolase [Flavobacterium rhizosphaerae]|uniref:Cellulase family glycosylhydrolase n=1 Tax=Flavobacterium rhizosphaerae TaxID=3163298 RepID=A0ABW8YX54_9FLAO
MKKIILILVLLLAGISYSQETQTTLKVYGKNLKTVLWQDVVLRGINYPIIDDGNISLSNASQYQHKIDQAAMTGANCIRIPWYTDGQHWRDQMAPGTINGYVNNGHLSNITAYCIQKGMIPILEIHDPGNITCSNNWTYFNTTVSNWWKSQQILDLIEENKEYLIINLANEFGYANWTGNSAQALQVFKTNYNTLISTLRGLGVKVPIMVDAPDCGQSSTELLSIAGSMVNADPEHNLIFSAHAYWYSYANTQAAVENKLDYAQNTNVCFVLGEVANRQDDNSCGQLNLSNLYPIILQEACDRGIGWLAWTYDQDCSAPRELTTNGEFNTLTAFGNDIVYNTNYGLIGGSCNATSILTAVTSQAADVILYPNPVENILNIKFSGSLSEIIVYDMIGKPVVYAKNTEILNLSLLPPGVYVLNATSVDGKNYKNKIVKK